MINLTNPLWGKLNTLSASRISSFFSCGARFRNEYIYEMKPPGGIPAFRGDAIHHAVAEDNKLFIDTNGRMSVDLLIEIAMEKFDEGIAKDGVFICKSKESELDTLIEKAKEQIELCMNMYADYPKDWSPVSVEERINIDVGYPLNLVAYMDMTDEDCCIWDWKTTAKTPAIYEGIQNWVYSKIFEKQFGIKPTFKYFCFVLTKKTPRIEIQQLAQVRDYTILDKYVETYLNAIEKEVFLPSTQWNFLCSEVSARFICAVNLKRMKGRKMENKDIKVFTGETLPERRETPQQNMMQTRTQYQAAMRVQVPRDEEKILVKLEKVAKYVGHDFFYLWPVKDKQGNVSMISGGTIDLAETLVYYWSNVAIEHDIEDLGNKWKIKHVFIDFERGLQVPRTTIISKPQSPPGGWDKERWERMCLNKANSYNLRDLVFTVIPRWMKNKIIDAAKSAEMEKASLEIKAGTADNFFIQIQTEYGVSKSDLLAFLKAVEPINAKVLFEVKNLYSQLKRGVVKADQIMMGQKEKPKYNKDKASQKETKKEQNKNEKPDIKSKDKPFLIKQIYKLASDAGIPVEALEESLKVKTLQSVDDAILDGIINDWEMVKKQFLPANEDSSAAESKENK